MPSIYKLEKMMKLNLENRFHQALSVERERRVSILSAVLHKYARE